MKNPFVRFRNLYLYATWYVQTLIRRKFPEKKKSEDDIAWEGEEMDRKRELKKNHYWMYVMERIEPFVVLPGFFLFFAEPFFRLLAPVWLWVIVRAWSAGAFGFAFGAWLLLPIQKRWAFWWRNEATMILKKINEAINHSTVGNRQVN